jgi:hypothetical protein
MADDAYDHDILEWAEHQAALLRRTARGERVNDVDWEHVIEEIEDVGLSELSAVRSYLRQLLIHMMKLGGWPESPAREHWRNELDIFQAERVERFAPSMRQRLDIPALYQQSLRAVSRMHIDGRPPETLSTECPFTLEELLLGDTAELATRLRAQSGSNDRQVGTVW